jgi:DNA replication protein DnaC
MKMIENTKETLRKLRLYGMLRAYDELLEQPQSRFNAHELMEYLAETEWIDRYNRAITRLTRMAQFRYEASISQLQITPERGIDSNLIQQLSEGMYLTQAQNVLITGPTGTGKSFMATALGRAACELGKRVRYANTARLTTELKQAKTEGSLIKELKKLEKTDLLILDDFGLQVLDATGRSLLMDVMEDRHGRKSTMVVGQIPITSWHEVIGDLTLADALMDRWVHGSYQIELDGESMRKKMSQTENTKAN